MRIKERLKNDYFGKNRYDQYKKVLKKAIDSGYSFVTLQNYDVNGKKQVVLRHDIDSDVRIAKKMFEIEKQLNIRSTYYFRLCTYNKKFIEKLIEYGCEVSYHFEEIATYAYKHNLNDTGEIFMNINQIRKNFIDNLEKFRKKSDCACATVASHGDFVNRKTGIINNELLTDIIRTEHGIVREAYDKELTDSAKYCSDGKADFIEMCDFSQADNYYLLVHPRTWSPNFFGRLILDAKRFFAGVKYKIGCKVHKAFRIMKEIRKLPKIQLDFVGEEHRETYKYFTKPHPKYIVFKNKSIGACLLKKPASFESYLEGKSKQNVRTSRNRCIKKGYIFREIEVKDYVDGILEINMSKSERQGHGMNQAYWDKNLIVEHAKGKECFGIFDESEKILAYCYLIDVGNFLIISRLLGHSDYLKDGVMFYMISECVKLWVGTDRWQKVEYFFYDTYFGASAGLKKFKSDLGFVPYKVKYKFNKR